MRPGLAAALELLVTDHDTAVADALPAGETTVGHRTQLDHVAPVRVGSTVRAEVTLDKV